MIDPEFWIDSRIKKLSYQERLFVVGMINHADDEGRLLADPAFLRSKIFPYDDVSLESLQTMLTNITTQNPNILLYSVNGDSYLAFLKWKRYQKPEYPKPSIYPSPPNIQNESPNDSTDIQPNQSPNDSPNQSPNDSAIGRVGLGKDRLGRGDSPKPTPNCFEVFTQEINLITPMLAEKLKDDVKEYSDEWVVDAIKYASAHGKKNIAYIEATLKGWRQDGKKGGISNKDKSKYGDGWK